MIHDTLPSGEVVGTVGSEEAAAEFSLVDGVIGRFGQGPAWSSNGDATFPAPKGLITALREMKKNAKAELTIAAGEYGQEEQVLRAEVEVLEIIEVKELMADGGVMMKMLEKGEAWKKPKVRTANV